MRGRMAGWWVGWLVAGAVSAQAWLTVDFDELPLGGASHWNGADESGGFEGRGIFFTNAYNAEWGSWAGFSYSVVNNPDTSGWDNQYAVYHPGTDKSGTGVYAVVYDDGPWGGSARMTFKWPARLDGVYLNNTAYAAHDMLQGGWFSKPFGGADGNDPDWFKVTITGRDQEGAITGEVDFYLADYRFEDPAQNYVVSNWTRVDLAGLGENVREVSFALSSSDVGEWGMNTPAYFAMDELSFAYAFSGPDQQDHPVDGAVPGFVGPEGDGNTHGANYVNAAFAGWAGSVIDYSPAASVAPEWSNPARALGPVSGDHFDIVSLGDLDAAQIAAGLPPGSITLGFDVAIHDGPGPDFVVFENAISTGGGELFGELAFVEVSSDGAHFARFPALSQIPGPVGPYASFDARQVYNLAGKHANAYGISWGTPFDLATLSNHPAVLAGSVDLQNIRQVRLVDIPGDGSFHDGSTPPNPVYDPWHTFGSGGFDLEAIGVLNSPDAHKIYLTATGPGRIAPYGQPLHAVSVRDGSNRVFHIEVDEGFHIQQVLVNGERIGATNTVRFDNVTGDQRLEARFGPPVTSQGVPYDWFARMNLTNHPPGEAARMDDDGDGEPNWKEYYAGTDPLDSNSVFRVLDLGTADGSNVLSWVSGTHGSDLPFRVLTTDDLLSGEWTPLQSGIERSGTGTNTLWFDNETNKRFYRIEVEID